MDKPVDVKQAIQANPVLSAVHALLEQQTAKGMEKYGTTVQFDTLSIIEWIDHASEEAMDKLVYLQALKFKLLHGTERKFVQPTNEELLAEAESIIEMLNRDKEGL